jgi:hypothetical protein
VRSTSHQLDWHTAYVAIERIWGQGPAAIRACWRIHYLSLREIVDRGIGFGWLREGRRELITGWLLYVLAELLGEIARGTARCIKLPELAGRNRLPIKAILYSWLWIIVCAFPGGTQYHQDHESGNCEKQDCTHQQHDN